MYISAQEIDTNEKAIEKPRLVLKEDFSYVNSFLNKEQHAYFIFEYKIKPKLSLEIQGFYNTYLLSKVFESYIVSKQYVSNKMYLFLGIGVESERDDFNLNLPPPQLKFKNGIGWDIQKSIQVELDYDLHFDTSVYGLYGFPSLFSLKGKYKF